MRDGARIYLRPDEEEPQQALLSKVMNIVAVARPRQLSNGAWFDGKIGIWPVIETVEAKDSSKNRVAGDMEIKSVTMDGEQYKQMIKKEVTPAIKARTPGASTRTIWVQQDGAKPYTRMGSLRPLRQRLGESSHWKPSHPNPNVLDLGFSHSI
ncbi:unnamed protein product [Discosporangium mesarthrocarpum]